MNGKPNNFPREGAHSIVTKEEIKRLEAARPTLNTEIHYTIEGLVETAVHSSLNAEREAAITQGARKMAKASGRLQNGFEQSQKRLRAAFSRAAYVREQQDVARQAQSRPKVRYHGPKR